MKGRGTNCVVHPHPDPPPVEVEGKYIGKILNIFGYILKIGGEGNIKIKELTSIDQG
jgi:hypothetical protein